MSRNLSHLVLQCYSRESFHRLEEEATEWQRSAQATAEHMLRLQLREATQREFELETELQELRDLHELKTGEELVKELEPDRELDF